MRIRSWLAIAARLQPPSFWLFLFALIGITVLFYGVPITLPWLAGLQVPLVSVSIVIYVLLLGSLAMPSPLEVNSSAKSLKFARRLRIAIIWICLLALTITFEIVIPESGNSGSFDKWEYERLALLFVGISMLCSRFQSVGIAWLIPLSYYLLCVFVIPPEGAPLSWLAIAFQQSSSQSASVASLLLFLAGSFGVARG